MPPLSPKKLPAGSLYGLLLCLPSGHTLYEQAVVLHLSIILHNPALYQQLFACCLSLSPCDFFAFPLQAGQNK